MPAGRKPIEIDLKEVERLASRGLTEAQIGAALGVSDDTITRRKQKYAEFAAAIKRGKAKGIGKIANCLFDQAEKGNTSATIFYLKNNAGWRDKQPDEDGSTVVNVTTNNYDKKK